MRILVQFAAAIRRSMERAAGQEDPKGAAEQLETTIKESVDIDGDVLLSLAPESIAGVMQVSGTEPQLAEYIARSLLLESSYLRDAGDIAKADVREAQAHAIGEAFDFEVTLDMLSEEEWEEFFSHINPEN